jgi:sodium/bile acid cotransporter 3/5
VNFLDSEEIGMLQLPVIVTRKERLIDKVFTISVATLVSVLFVNFGCALDRKILLENLRKPTSLLIGIVPQFIFMPLVRK